MNALQCLRFFVVLLGALTSLSLRAGALDPFVSHARSRYGTEGERAALFLISKSPYENSIDIDRGIRAGETLRNVEESVHFH